MKEKNLNLKTIIFTFAGAMMIAHGTRMIYQGIFKPNTYYQPGTFDLFFDWGILTTFGIFVFLFSIKTYYSNQKQQNKPHYNL